MRPSFVNDLLAADLRREIAAPFASIRNLGFLAVLALLAGFAGPFGTYDALSPPARHLYWLLIVLGTAVAGHATGCFAEQQLSRLAWPDRERLLAASAFTTVPVFGVVALVLYGFGFQPDGKDLLILYVQCAAVVGCVAFVTFRKSPAAEQAADAPATPILLERLPQAKRGRLIRLCAQDHYVEVTTERGRSLVLMRFSDAMAEAAPEPGIQVHRSHWVALHAISGRCRQDTRNGFRMSDGSFVPIGRTFRSKTREAGV